MFRGNECIAHNFHSDNMTDYFACKRTVNKICMEVLCEGYIYGVQRFRVMSTCYVTGATCMCPLTPPWNSYNGRLIITISRDKLTPTEISSTALENEVRIYKFMHMFKNKYS